MLIEIIDDLFDKRMDCISILFITNVKSYMNFIEEIFSNKGGIEGQRAPLRNKSAIEIRKRLIVDIEKGAVIPPIVLGLLSSPEQFDSIKTDRNIIKELLNDQNNSESFSLIDGMQRTAALKDAVEKNPHLDTSIRIELWVAKNVNNLIYRMLVLNTAQIPWSVKRQLEVVFGSLSKSIKEKIPGIDLFHEDQRSRRSKAGQYQANHIVELFIGFSLRKIQVELKESISEEFARLDIIESSSSSGFSDTFIKMLDYLFKIDKLYEKAKPESNDIQLKKFKCGYDIFSSHPARMGFLTAISQKIYGKPGIKYDQSKIDRLIESICLSLDQYISRCDSMDSHELYNFLDFPSLDERINIPSGKVGEFERAYFLKVFYEFIEIIQSSEELKNMTPVWLAYH